MTEQQIDLDSFSLDELAKLLESLEENYRNLRQTWTENFYEEDERLTCAKKQLRTYLLKELNNTANLIEDILKFIRKSQQTTKDRQRTSRSSSKQPKAGVKKRDESVKSVKNVVKVSVKRVRSESRKRKSSRSSIACSASCLGDRCKCRSRNSPLLREMKTFNTLVKKNEKF